MDEEGISLHDFAEQEAPDESPDVAASSPDPTPESEAPETPADREDRGDPLRDEKPADAGETPPDAESPKPADGPAPDAPEGDAEPEKAEGAKTPAADELGELTRRGWPKPKYSDDDLKGNEQALEVNRHWRNVFSRSRQEVADFRKQFDGIEPEDAKQHKAVYDDILTNPKYEGVRAHAGIVEHPISPDAAAFSRALDDKNNPDHLAALQMFQRMRAGGQPAQPAPVGQPAQQSILLQATDEYGDIDEAKFNSLMQERDRQIANAVLQRARSQPAQTSDAPTQPPKTAEGPDVVEQFADFHGLNASEIRPLLLKELHRSRADGVEPEDSIKGIKILWDRVLASRETSVQAERQAEVARLKGASTSRPRSAVPDGGDPATGLSLYDFAASERESTQ